MICTYHSRASRWFSLAAIWSVSQHTKPWLNHHPLNYTCWDCLTAQGRYFVANRGCLFASKDQQVQLGVVGGAAGAIEPFCVCVSSRNPSERKCIMPAHWPHLRNRHFLFPSLPVPPFGYKRVHKHTSELHTCWLLWWPTNDAGTQEPASMWNTEWIFFFSA